MSAFVKKALALSAALLIGLSYSHYAPVAGAEGAPGSGRTAAAPASPSGDTHEGHQGKRHGKGHFILKESAKLFDMDCSTLSESLNSGKSLAGIAKEKKGWSEEQYVQKLAEAAGERIDKAVAEGRFTQEQAKKLKDELPALLKARVNEKGSFPEHLPSRKPPENNG
ncbi:hypothetical protein SAMN04487895_103192 [Paenibacillus sophorae]|uniref:Uncharacterized protein n=1 Tax=Paenibacillus sophorae TaxID=1333845 RepID=A0A1H8JXJ2_9BACL|nr:hypothetical protein [Paenibacillus sophorae]QWU13522.1 hypothetical protein KP014_16130 [Paenibacillus sophorae]SEN85439.1 hypothetical protein SAMN04487895_103192 [Paenibacillus sophorae]